MAFSLDDGRITPNERAFRFASNGIRNSRPCHLHVFDMDGTLLHGSTASVEIARTIGVSDALVELELAYSTGELDEASFARETWALFSHLPPAQVRQVFDDAPWLAGIAEAVHTLHEDGHAAIVITISPNYFADHLLDFGFDAVVASAHPPLGSGQAFEDTTGVLTSADKVTIVHEWLDRLDLSEDECTAYGDSGSDVPLFSSAARTVAVNATPQLQALASVSYQGYDLREAVAAGASIGQIDAEFGEL